jgi:hypothetical protein
MHTQPMAGQENRAGAIGATIKVDCCVVLAKSLGGRLYKLEKSIGTKSIEERDLLKPGKVLIAVDGKGIFS